MNTLSYVKYYLFTAFYIALLTFAYINIISVSFSYAGLIYSFSVPKAAEACAAVILLSLFTPKSLAKPSDFYLNILFLLVFVPLAVLFCLSDENPTTFYSITGGIVLIYIFTAFVPPLSISRSPRVNFRVLVSVLSFALVAITAAQVALAGRLSFNYSLLDVYEYREQSNEMTGVGALAYLRIWASKVLLPSLVAFSICLGHNMKTVLLCIIAFILFGITQAKSVLFYPYIVIAVLLVFRIQKNLWLLPSVLSVFVLAVVIVDSYFSDILLTSLFVRRVLFVPAYLVFKYFEFFSANELVWWSSSFMSGFIQYPYKVNTARVIGEYLGGEFNANNTFLATGYMHAGYFGLFFYCILVGAVLKLVDSITADRVPVALAVALTAVPFFELFTSADLPTALLTHGAALSILLLYFSTSPSVINNLSRTS